MLDCFFHLHFCFFLISPDCCTPSFYSFILIFIINQLGCLVYFTLQINSQHCKDNKFMKATWLLPAMMLFTLHICNFPCPLFSLFRLSFSERFCFNLYLCNSSLYMRSSVSGVPRLHMVIINSDN